MKEAISNTFKNSRDKIGELLNMLGQKLYNKIGEVDYIDRLNDMSLEERRQKMIQRNIAITALGSILLAVSSIVFVQLQVKVDNLEQANKSLIEELEKKYQSKETENSLVTKELEEQISTLSQDLMEALREIEVLNNKEYNQSLKEGANNKDR